MKTKNDTIKKIALGCDMQLPSKYKRTECGCTCAPKKPKVPKKK